MLAERNRRLSKYSLNLLFDFWQDLNICTTRNSFYTLNNEHENFGNLILKMMRKNCRKKGFQLLIVQKNESDSRLISTKSHILERIRVYKLIIMNNNK